MVEEGVFESMIPPLLRNDSRFYGRGEVRIILKDFDVRMRHGGWRR
jgi:hypothetical protein